MAVKTCHSEQQDNLTIKLFPFPPDSNGNVEVKGISFSDLDSSCPLVIQHKTTQQLQEEAAVAAAAAAAADDDDTSTEFEVVLVDNGKSFARNLTR